MGSGDYLDVVEATYRVDGVKPRAWIETIARVAEPLIGEGLGVLGMTYDASNPARMRVVELVTTGDDRLATIARHIVESGVDQAYVERTYRALPCALSSETPDVDATGFDAFHSFGIRDLLGINGLDPTGCGCFLGAFLGAAPAIPRARRRLLTRISAHLASGYRLLRWHGAESRGEAILTPGGRVEHAEGEAELASARSRLADAVQAVERARGKLRRDPDLATAAWRAMVSARWTLVDKFDSDGKRYVVARVNDAMRGRIDSLSPREHQVAGFVALGHAPKLVAYELGLSESTVRVLLSRVYAKLGVRTRAEFLESWKLGFAPDRQT